MIELSPEQLLFVEKALSGSNILVDACVGSGKTTAIQFLCQQIPLNKNILYLTYNKLLKLDAQKRITKKNVTVTNYHGFASMYLRESGIKCGVTDLIQTFIKHRPAFPFYDILIIDEYQDIDTELSEFLEIIKSSNPSMQIVAVGDIEQKIYDKTVLNITEFINHFLGNHICLEFTQCFRLNPDHAAMLGRIWNKSIIGVNDSCRVLEMSVEEAISFISATPAQDVLCLGKRIGDMTLVLNHLETKFPERFNKKTVYASIKDDEGFSVDPRADAAIFTTYDSSKGLERKICLLFDFTEDYWFSRAEKPLQSYERLRNIFCVAASRGKEAIIFVKSKAPLLSEKTLSTPTRYNDVLRNTCFSEMFDYKYKESIESCYSLLNLKKLSMDDSSIISVKTRDEMIDLSPCIGIYQEASYFNNYDIDKEIELFCKLHENFKNNYNESIKRSGIERKILFLTAIENRQLRYINQVSVPYISKSEKELLHNRLATWFSKDDESQVYCRLTFDCIPGYSFNAEGFADVVKDNIVYELKFVSELTHEHFLQCACYIVALKLKKGILWNTRNNDMYEISIPDEDAFLHAVANAVLKRKEPYCEKNGIDTDIANKQFQSFEKNNDGLNASKKDYYSCFAVIDTETNWKDSVMSIGICIVNSNDYRIIEKKYYILPEEASVGGMYENFLYCEDYPKPITLARVDALNSIQELFRFYSIIKVFSYNASFESKHLPELNDVSWYDIMKIASYKQFNSKIPDSFQLCSTGRLKKDFGVESIMRLLSEDSCYIEKHNALTDAVDEVIIMRLLNQPYNVYLEYAAINSKPRRNKSFEEYNSGYELAISPRIQKRESMPNQPNYVSAPSLSFVAEEDSKRTPRVEKTTRVDVIFADKAAAILGVRTSEVYRLIRNGMIEAEKVNNKYHISKDSVMKYLTIKNKIDKWRIAIFSIVGIISIVVFIIIFFNS